MLIVPKMQMGNIVTVVQTLHMVSSVLQSSVSPPTKPTSPPLNSDPPQFLPQQDCCTVPPPWPDQAEFSRKVRTQGPCQKSSPAERSDLENRGCRAQVEGKLVPLHHSLSTYLQHDGGLSERTRIWLTCRIHSRRRTGSGDPHAASFCSRLRSEVVEEDRPPSSRSRFVLAFPPLAELHLV